MKKELSNEEISKVFALYLGCEVVSDHSNDQLKRVLKGIVTKKLISDTNLSLSKLKLLLTPLSGITDEDAIEVAKVYVDSILENSTDEDMIVEGRFIVTQIAGIKIQARWNILNVNQCFQYLISKGYAVPLFFGIDHWANGETAIELDIALDATKINIL